MSMMSGKLHENGATYWAKSGSSDASGSYSFAAPVAVSARWQEQSEQIRTQAGDDIVSKSVVYVDRDMAEGDYLAPGVFADTDPQMVASAQEIQAFFATDNLRFMEKERRAYL